jgi:hypothetical protein
LVKRTNLPIQEKQLVSKTLDHVALWGWLSSKIKTIFPGRRRGRQGVEGITDDLSSLAAFSAVLRS